MHSFVLYLHYVAAENLVIFLIGPLRTVEELRKVEYCFNIFFTSSLCTSYTQHCKTDKTHYTHAHADIAVQLIKFVAQLFMQTTSTDLVPPLNLMSPQPLREEKSSHPQVVDAIQGKPRTKWDTNVSGL